jgi:uncharacterized YccA/Bax inhibitor family protein
MESRNPVFSRSETFSRGGYATFDQTPSNRQLEDMYAAPPATPTQMRRMTIDDVVIRTGILFAILIASGAAAWVLNFGIGIALIAALAAFGVAMAVTFMRQASPPLVMVYAALEGVFVGTLSHYFEARWPGIVSQAVLGTLAAFAGMLVLYRSGKLRATPKFQKMLIVAAIGYLVISLVSVLSAIFLGVGDGWGFFGVGALGILLCVAGVALASFFLILDFDYIEQGIRHGAPEREAWRAGFGLLVTLVWLYLELLRLLAILRGE